MDLTINWLLSHGPKGKNFSCMAGHNGLQNIITGINIIDNPDTIPWLKPHELILSTGYIFTSSNIYTTIIQNLAARNCSGLGIKLNRYMDRLPEEMIEQANLLNFPIFSIPYTCNLEEIVNIVYHQMFQNQMTDTEHRMAFYKSISEAVLKGSRLLTILEKITKKLKMTAFFTTSDFQIIEYSFYKKDDRAYPFSFMENRNYLFSKKDSEKLQLQNTKKEYPVYDHTIRQDGLDYHFVLFPIYQNKRILGYLICLEGASSFSSFEYDMISNLSSILAIVIMQENMSLKDHHLNQTSFYYELLSETQKSEREIELLCRQFNFNYILPRICVTLRQPGYNSMSIERQRSHINKIMNILSPIVASYSFKLQYTLRNYDLILFIVFPDTANKQLLQNFILCMNQIESSLSEKDFSPYIGYSQCLTGASTIYTTYTQSIKALDLGKKLHPDLRIFSYENDHVYHMLSENIPSKELEKYYNTYLKPLVLFDQDNNTTLTETLSEYISCRQNISQAAKNLFIHRNTMINRMNQIWDILPIDISDPDQFYLLMTAFYAAKILEV